MVGGLVAMMVVAKAACWAVHSDACWVDLKDVEMVAVRVDL